MCSTLIRDVDPSLLADLVSLREALLDAQRDTASRYKVAHRDIALPNSNLFKGIGFIVKCSAFPSPNHVDRSTPIIT